MALSEREELELLELEKEQAITGMKAGGRQSPEMTMGRAAGLTARGLWQGATSLLTAPVDLGMAVGSRAMGLVGKMAGLDTENGNYTNAGELVSKGITAAGLPEPKTAGERLYSDVVGAAGGVLGGNALAKLALKYGPQAGSTGVLANQAIERALTQKMPQQYIGAIGAAEAGGMARELGLPWWAQIPAAIAGGSIAQAGTGAAKRLYDVVGDKVGDVSAAVMASKGDKAAIDRLAADAIREATKNQKDEIIAAMQTGGTQYVRGVNPSVTERLAGRNLASQDVVGSEVAALQSGLENYGPTRDIFASARKQNVAALAAPLERIAKGSTIKEINKAIEDQATKRDILTGNVRETALDQADIANVIAPKLRQGISQREADAASATGVVRSLEKAAGTAEQRANTTFLPEGQPRVPGKYTYMGELPKTADRFATQFAEMSRQKGNEARFLKSQLASLEQSGLREISVEPIMSAISKTLNTPGERGATNKLVLNGVVKDLQDLINDGGGVLRSRDLAKFRREGMNDVIGRLLHNADDATKQHAASVLIKLKPAIDKAIVDAGGKDWPRYLSRYSKLRDLEDQMAGAGALLQRLRTETGKENMPQMMRALGPGEEQFTKQISKGATELSDIFTPNQMKTVIEPMEKEVQRMTAANEFKRGVTGGVSPSQVAGSDMPQLPQFINAKITITNAILRKLGGDANTPVAKRVADILANDSEQFIRMANSQSRDPASILARDWLQKATIGSAILMGQQQGRSVSEAQQ